MRVTVDVISWRIWLLLSAARGDRPSGEIVISQGTGKAEYRFVLPLEEAKKMAEHILACVDTAEKDGTVHYIDAILKTH